MNTFENDSRVDRSARALVEQGHQVTLLCLYRKGLPRREKINGYEVIRCELGSKKTSGKPSILERFTNAFRSKKNSPSSVKIISH